MVKFGLKKPKMPSISVPKKKGCSQRDKLGTKNNLPFWVFMAAVMSRAVYQFDGLFQHLIKSYFNNKFILEQFMKLKDKNEIDLYELIQSEKAQSGGQEKKLNIADVAKIKIEAGRAAKKAKRIVKLMERVKDQTTFPKNSAQYLATLVNTTNDIAIDFTNEKILIPKEGGKKNKAWNKDAHNTVFTPLYTALPEDYKEMKVTDNDDLSFVYVRTDHDMNCFVVYHKPSKTLMVTFRGTSSIKSSIEDIKAITTYVITPTNIADDNKQNYGNMHQGFLQQQIGSFHRIVYAMKMLVEKAHASGDPKPTKDNLKLFVFGHSLGGANTTVFSYFYQYWKVQMSKVLQAPYLNVPLYVVSWGQPRVGTKIFARDYFKLMVDPKTMRPQSGGQEASNGKIHFIRAKTDGDLIPEVPKTVNLLKKENAYFHVGEDVNISNQTPYQCNSRIDKVTQQLHYKKPLQCDHRFSCSTAKGMFAHTNAAYISFMTILKAAGGGFGATGLEYVYNNLNGTRQEGKIKGYSKHFLMSNKLYEDEMLNNTVTLTIKPHPGTQDDKKTRISTEKEFGTFMRGHQPSMIKAPSIPKIKAPSIPKMKMPKFGFGSKKKTEKKGGRMKRKTKRRRKKKKHTKKKRRRKRKGTKKKRRRRR